MSSPSSLGTPTSGTATIGSTTSTALVTVSSSEQVSVAAAVPQSERLPNPTQAPLAGQVVNLASEARNREALNLTVSHSTPTDGAGTSSGVSTGAVGAGGTSASSDPSGASPVAVSSPTSGSTTGGASGASTTTGSSGGGATTTVATGGTTNSAVAPTVTPPLVQPLPEPVVTWGRWAAFANSPAPAADTQAFKAANGPFVGTNEAYVLSVSNSANVRMPETGQFAFKLTASEAFETRGNIITAAASVTRGELSVNFGARSFVTSLDVQLSDVSLALRSEGRITSAGELDGYVLYALPGLNMSVQGQLGGQLSNRAGYIFTATVGGTGRGVVGATSWSR